jgi:predicted DNA binding CopG/RHH family protein
MATHELDAEEQAILDSYERGEWQSIPTLSEERQRYQASAVAALRKSRRVSVSLPPEDFEAIRQRAIAKGVPYQTLIASIVHQFVAGHLVEQP